MSRSQRRKKFSAEPVTAHIESLSHEGRGIAHIDGKVVIVDAALPGEEILFRYRRQHTRHDEGRLIRITHPSPARITARCRHFEICGGCRLQHMRSEDQLRHKEAVLLEQLSHIGGLSPVEIPAPLAGPVWGYRRRARLSVKYDEKKDRVLVGFRERYSRYIAELDQCEVLHPAVGRRLRELGALIRRLSVCRQLPQIEIAVADRQAALVFRHLAPLTDGDLEILEEYENRQQMAVYLQAGGPETVTPLSPDKNHALSYSLPDHGIEFFYQPVDFIQNNFEINMAMVNRAMELLAPESHDHVLDLYCGIGNFSLPLARRTATVTGIEGNTGLVERAKFNAMQNRIENVEFQVNDLAGRNLDADFLQRVYQKILLDPPRTGALEIIRQMDFPGTGRIVYISCNPATLARDAAVLVQEKGFCLQQSGVIDMFPHTSHIESISLFVR